MAVSDIKDDIKELKSAVDGIENQVNQLDKTLAQYAITLEHHQKQDERMYEELKRMNDILMSNTESLKQHMRRTELLEEAVIKMDARISPIELESIRKAAVREWLKENAIFAGKVLAAVLALGSVIAGGKALLVKFLIH